MGKTISEKIFSHHCGREVSAGEIVTASVDFAMAQDGTAPLAIKAFEEMGGSKVWDSRKVAFFIDHNAPSPSSSVSELHSMMRQFASRQKIELSDVGGGVCHQLMVEGGRALPGGLVVGADSHTTTYGALNCFATGVGSSDLAATMLSGSLWFRVPQSLKINVMGELPPGVFAKDVALRMVGDLGADGANYLALEIEGETIEGLSIEERLTISNMAVEVGAKAGLMRADEKTLDFLRGRTKGELEPVEPDPDALYVRKLQIKVDELTPLVSMPHRVDDVHNLEEVEGIPIAQGFIGTCTNGRLEDLRQAARILRGKRVLRGVRLIIAPASREVLLDSLQEGLIQVFVEAGAVVAPPGCACCVGTHQGIPSDGENVISTANRNFRGRMGNPKANIFLASPATVAASSIEGSIADPRSYLA